MCFDGIALIASGLSKNLSNQEFRQACRRFWYKLMGIGFLVMIVSMVPLVLIGMVGTASLVSWLYWFVWTWFSWKYADSKTIEKLRVRI